MNMSTDALAITQQTQLSNSVLTKMEKSIFYLNNLVESLPSVVCIINSKGLILQANSCLGELFSFQNSDILHGESIRRILNDQTWDIFSKGIEDLTNSNTDGYLCEVEAPISIEKQSSDSNDKIGNECKIIKWSLKQLKEVVNCQGGAYLLTGTDVTAVRENERKLSQVYNTIPLAILYLDKELKIKSPYTQFACVLFGENDLENMKFVDLVYKPGLSQMTLQDKEKAKNLDGVIGFSEFHFDLVQNSLLNKVHLKTNDLDRWIKIHYSPLIEEGSINGLLAIIEDITSVENLRLQKDKYIEKSKQSVDKISQLRKIDKNLIKSIFTDLHFFFSSLKNQLDENGDNANILRLLHSIKGTSRIAQIENLMNLSHKIETEIISHGDDYKHYSDLLNELFEEWNEITTIFEDINYTDNKASVCITNLTSSVETIANDTAEVLNKKVKIEFDFPKVKISQRQASTLRECLLHLVSNAIDHGIESPEQRLKTNKNEFGSIIFKAVFKDNQLFITAEDDGRGINLSKLKEKALNQGVLTKDELKNASEKYIMELVFKPQLSQADKVSVVSGRGIGLDIVKARLKDIKGEISVDKGKYCGTKFSIKIDLNLGR